MEFGSKFVYVPTDNDDEEISSSDNDSDFGIYGIDNLKIKDGEGEVCMLDILDTAGQEEYSTLREKYMKESQAFVIVYAIDDQTSFKEALDMHKLIKIIQKVTTFPAVLCGNKSDLESDRKVSRADAEKESKVRDVAFVETSAKTGSNIREAFEELIRRTPRNGIHYKITVLGSGGVGKSSVVIRLTQDMFMADYDPTIEDTFRKTITVKGIRRDIIIPSPPIGRGRACDVAVLSPPRPPMLLASTSHAHMIHKKPSKIKKGDGNIILISLGTLKNDPKIMTGDAVSCSNCSAILSHVSTVAPSSSGDSSTQVWKCEFCDNTNELDISVEEIPKESPIDFLLEVVSEQQGSEVTLETDKPTSRAGVVIYCIDVSTSMGTTTALPQLQAEWYALRGGAVTSMTRLDCIKQAVKRQLDYHEIESPDKAVGIVTFGSPITFMCDKPRPTNVNYKHASNKLEELLQIGQDLAQTENIKPLSENATIVNNQVTNLRLCGSTALGPALALSVGFLKKTPGSEIVLCTDGEPNVGIGKLPQDRDFYDKIGNIAKDQQTTISVIGIQTDRAYNIETVSNAAAVTGGTINLLSPHELSHKMREITQDVVVATNVEVTVILHPCLCFVSKKADVNDKSMATCSLGNVHKDTELTFRFQKRKNYKTVDASQYPFQIQVRYTTKDGRRFLRVLTEKRDATTSREDMEKNLNIPVVGVTTLTESSTMADDQARQHLQTNLGMTHRHASRSTDTATSFLSYQSAVNDRCFMAPITKWSKHLRMKPHSKHFHGERSKRSDLTGFKISEHSVEHRKKFYKYGKSTSKEDEK